MPNFNPGLMVLLSTLWLIGNSTTISAQSDEEFLMQNHPTKNTAYENWYENNRTYKKPDKSILRKNLTDLQYEVTQNDDTERAFRNTYWDNKAEGIYVDIVSGEPLFSSKDKFKSGTGWPSFTRSIDSDAIVTHEDRSLFGLRIELRSRLADSHLGHVFADGPKPTRLRYCINSASLRFIPRNKLQSEGYAEFEALFE